MGEAAGRGMVRCVGGTSRDALLRVAAVAVHVHAAPPLPHHVHSKRYAGVGCGQQAQAHPVCNTGEEACGYLVVAFVAEGREG